MTRTEHGLVCKRGHLLTPENTYAAPSGTLVCRICKTDNLKRWTEKHRPRKDPELVKQARAAAAEKRRTVMFKDIPRNAKRNGVRCRCPSCRSADIHQRIDEKWYCKRCKFTFDKPDRVSKNAKQVFKSKSGVVAGRIEIGRGSVWGASII
jgi:ribosomal protein L37AE/L43A